MLIDFHAHFDSADRERVRAFVRAAEQNSCVTVFSGGDMGDDHYAPSETVLKFCREFRERLIPAIKLDLADREFDLSQLRKRRDQGFKAVKFIYPYYEYDHDLYMPIYEELQKLELPALFHTGIYRPQALDETIRRPMLLNMDPYRLDRIARSFPRLRIVEAHLGTAAFRLQGAQMVKIHANVYADLGGCGNWMAVTPQMLAELLCDNLYVRDASARYFGKLIFGSDCYITIPEVQTRALRYYRHIMEMNDLPPETRDAIMGGTVARWLKFRRSSAETQTPDILSAAGS